MGSPVIFRGTKAQLLNMGSVQFKKGGAATVGVQIIPLIVDPSAGGGIVADEGSLGLRDDGSIYLKTGAGDTAWALVEITDTTDHTALSNIGTNAHTVIDTHLADLPKHVDWASASTGTVHATNYVDNDTTDHTALSNIGTNAHSAIDTHLANLPKHVDWAAASAGTIHATNYVDNDTTDHTALSNIGTNAHTAIDTHLADLPKHVDWAAASAGTIHTDNYIENATHTVDVTGDTVLTLESVAITNKPAATVASGDLVLISDLDGAPAGALSKVTAQSIADLAGGGGETNLAANVGTGTGLVFRDKTGVTLNMKSILAGENITITNNADEVQLDVPGDRLPPPLEFNLHGLVTIPLIRFGAGNNINGPREITGIRIHAFDSGTAGSTTVRIHRSNGLGGSAASVDIVLPSNSGLENKAASGVVSLTGIAGDVFYAELVSVATGGVEDLSVECFFGSEGLMSKITVGGRELTDLTNLKILKSYGSVANNYSEWRLEDGTQYTSAGAAGFRVHAVKVTNNSGNDQGVALCYGDTAVGLNSGAGPTTTIFEGGLTAQYPYGSGTEVSGSGEYPSDFLIPTGKEPHIKLQGAFETQVIIYGYEE